MVKATRAPALRRRTFRRYDSGVVVVAVDIAPLLMTTALPKVASESMTDVQSP